MLFVPSTWPVSCPHSQQWSRNSSAYFGTPPYAHGSATHQMVCFSEVSIVVKPPSGGTVNGETNERT